MKKIKSIICIGMSCLVTLMTGCIQQDKDGTRNMVIATQVGFAHLPSIIIKEDNLLDKYLPEGVNVEFVEITGGGSAVREAMAAGKVDIGNLGIPPILIGIDKEIPIKVIQGLSATEYKMVTNKDDINELTDFTKNDKIALLQLGSIHHIMLSLITEKLYGNALMLEDNIIVMPEGDSVAALEAGSEISGYLGSQPTVHKAELTPGNKVLFSTKELLGDLTTVAMTTTEDFANENLDLVNAMKQATIEAVNYIANNAEECGERFADEFNLTEEEFVTLLKETMYTDELLGYDEISNFMYEQGYIDKQPLKIEEIIIE